MHACLYCGALPGAYTGTVYHAHGCRLASDLDFPLTADDRRIYR